MSLLKGTRSRDRGGRASFDSKHTTLEMLGRILPGERKKAPQPWLPVLVISNPPETVLIESSRATVVLVLVHGYDTVVWEQDVTHSCFQRSVGV